MFQLVWCYFDDRVRYSVMGDYDTMCHIFINFIKPQDDKRRYDVLELWKLGCPTTQYEEKEIPWFRRS